MTMNWRLFNKNSDKTIAIVRTDRSISLDDCITLAGFEAYEGEKECQDDPDYFRVDTEPVNEGGITEIWYDDVDYELI